ncbi:hypothetical protein PsorP6_001443 [Peronosclerospora sorghi]|uniref:Uncharacterized protein n=1 Tax=Peronosclerospora sorghi TaxID=230839 RepID=A0ACC0WQC5_9STRA|nr:hypothetical protein PsorP6_001443 [Peronosclerospora sorghi]
MQLHQDTKHVNAFKRREQRRLNRREFQQNATHELIQRIFLEQMLQGIVAIVLAHVIVHQALQEIKHGHRHVAWFCLFCQLAQCLEQRLVHHQVAILVGGQVQLTHRHHHPETEAAIVEATLGAPIGRHWLYFQCAIHSHDLVVVDAAHAAGHEAGRIWEQLQVAKLLPTELCGLVDHDAWASRWASTLRSSEMKTGVGSEIVVAASSSCCLVNASKSKPSSPVLVPVNTTVQSGSSNLDTDGKASVVGTCNLWSP